MYFKLSIFYLLIITKMFYQFSSEHVNRSVGNIQLQVPNDSFYFITMTTIFTLVVIMIISLSSTSSVFLPFMVLLVINVFFNLMFLFLLHTAKNWMHVIFSSIDSIFLMEEIMRTRFPSRAPVSRKSRYQSNSDDEIGDVSTPAPAKKDNTLRIDMDRLNNAIKKNLFT
jgi:hypothetical protein